MNKKEVCFILEACLLTFDKVSIKDLIKVYGIPEPYASAGFKLGIYLDTIELKKKEGEIR